MRTFALLAGATLLLLAAAAEARAQDDPLKGTWLVRGEDDRGPYEGQLRFERLEVGRYLAHARLASIGLNGVDRSYDAPAVLAGGTLTILRPTGIGIIGALEAAGTERVIVTASALRVRSGPGTNHPQIGLVKRDDKLDVLGREGDWYRVQTASGPAYVNAPYVKLDAPLATEWKGTYLGGNASWKGTWVRGPRTLGSESLARIRESSELTFAAIDLTTHKDSIDFATRFRQTFNWKNLIEKLPGSKDAAHPDMVIQDGVVLPYGPLREINKYTTLSDLTSSVAIKNVATARAWVPNAGIRLSADGTRGQLLGGEEVCDGEVSYASFMFVSSHGYPSGKIKYTPTFTPSAWFDGTILDVHDLLGGKRWRNGQTRWLMLALCNVLREEHWQSWAEALRDDQGLRGVLGYFRAAPGPEGTRIINERFFQAAQQGKSILDCWKFANYEVSQKEGVLTWCALVREDAVGDRIDEWTRTGKLPETRPGSRVLYFSTLPAEKQGIPVARTEGNVAAASVAWITSGRPVTPAEVSRGGGLVPGQTYDLDIKLPRPLAADEKIELTFVNVRETYWEQHGELDVYKLFDVVDPTAVLEKKGVYPPTTTHVDTLVTNRTRLALLARNDLLAHVHANEAELWVKVTVTNAAGEVVARGSSLTEPLIARPIGANPHGP